MDVNATLAELRDAMNALDGIETGSDAWDDAISRVVELWTALDGWLKSGGFSPAEWQRDPA